MFFIQLNFYREKLKADVGDINKWIETQKDDTQRDGSRPIKSLLERPEKVLI